MEAARSLTGERYDVGETLGGGGTGVVYAAFDHKRGHELALKRLLTDRFERAADLARATAHFEREYHTLSQLAHP